MKIEANLTQREADAVLRAELSVGWGVRKSQALQTAEMKLIQAVVNAKTAATMQRRTDRP